MHLQLMKRSGPLLGFLATEGALSDELFDIVWTASRSAFRDQAVAVTSLFSEIDALLPVPVLALLLRRIVALPAPELDTETVQLLAGIGAAHPITPGVYTSGRVSLPHTITGVRTRNHTEHHTGAHYQAHANHIRTHTHIHIRTRAMYNARLMPTTMQLCSLHTYFV
jgi:hypothetical protein